MCDIAKFVRSSTISALFTYVSQCVSKVLKQSAINTISFNHPTLSAQLPLLPDVANAFDWSDERRSMEEKYAGAIGPLRALYDEIAPLTVTR